ncbi:hypothetical protein [Chroococcus sp. FPU101]|uniref:hypothetical protein n=1 Tax=Chroococcus sp. FPU101 TaxID=1974212 RepID=UPI001A8D2DC6|nr:hypothetical protein [Chroococcus sp. FPU101]GFE71212.1 hypothetical protein CFPU101_38220 [Chroococcus sp. FPU101]
MCRIFAILNFTEFCGDQIRDAITTMEMWKGNLPTLGPISSWRSAYLPPLYFYFVFPFTAISSDLSSQAIFNGITTFFSIPLLMFTIYQSLEKVESNKRFFLATLAGLWYSLLFQNIVMNTGNSLAGNPGSVVFFLLAFILLFTYILEDKLSSIKECLFWLAYGFCFVSLINLQFAPLFVMPVIFMISIFIYLYKNRKNPQKFILPCLAILTVLIALTPYWFGEIERNWLNSKEILALVFKTGEEPKYSMSFFQRLIAVIRGYFDIGKDGYFIGTSRLTKLISILFMGVILLFGILKYRGNQTIYYLWLMISLVFLYAYSSVNMQNTYNPLFYRLLIYLVPIFLTIWCLAYLNFSSRSEKLIIIFLAFSITFCILINLKFHYNYITARVGMPRVQNTTDLVQIVREIPNQATVCDAINYYRNLRIYEYIDRYITQKKIQFIGECYPTNYLIYQKYLSHPRTYRLINNKPISEIEPKFTYPYHLYKETPLFYIYQID